jgi:hypothetical protein
VKESKLVLLCDLDHTLLSYNDAEGAIVGRHGLGAFLNEMAGYFQLHAFTQVRSW